MRNSTDEDSLLEGEAAQASREKREEEAQKEPHRMFTGENVKMLHSAEGTRLS